MQLFIIFLKMKWSHNIYQQNSNKNRYITTSLLYVVSKIRKEDLHLLILLIATIKMIQNKIIIYQKYAKKLPIHDMIGSYFHSIAAKLWFRNKDDKLLDDYNSPRVYKFDWILNNQRVISILQ